MEFKKYPSIENHYQDKFIRRWIERNPELPNVSYIVTEKIHGANFQIMIDEHGIEFASRNRILSPDENFNDYQNVMKDCEELIEAFQRIAISYPATKIRLYGEIFGDGIQKGVKYGEKQFRLFDVLVDNEILPPRRVMNFLLSKGLERFHVPIIGIFDSLEEALMVDTKFNSRITNQEGNICEGVVIKPYDECYIDSNMSPFYIKKKNIEFLERKSTPRERTALPDTIVYAQEVFSDYITTQRIDNVFSKEGEIEYTTEMGKYIQLIMEDAKVDFLKDNPDILEQFDEKEKKKVFGRAGGEIAKLLKERL